MKINRFLHFGNYCILIIFLCHCETFTIKAPKNFVVYTKKNHPFRAISAEGVRFRLKKIPNEPKGDASLWGKTIDIHLKKSGYHILESKEITAGKGITGHYSISLYKHSQQNFSYLTAIFVKNDEIYLIEVAGQYQDFQNHKQNILKSIKSFQLE